MNVSECQQQFPALSKTLPTKRAGGKHVVWACAPGGTQVPSRVIQAMLKAQSQGLSNRHGCFGASEDTERLVDQARNLAAMFLNAADVEEVHFGSNATSMTFHLSHALFKSWKKDDEVIVTELDHDANVSPWVLAAEQKGMKVKVWTCRDDGQLHREDLVALLGPKVKVLAVTAASNALGSITDLSELSKELRAYSRALLVVDAVHLAPHQALDVQEIDCDVLTCSAYKFFGPHLSLQYIRSSLRSTLSVDKVEASSNDGASRWETGTLNFVGLAGFVACMEYLLAGCRGLDESLVMDAPSHEQRQALLESFADIRMHEEVLSTSFLGGLQALDSYKLYGCSDSFAWQRTPTFSISHERASAKKLCKHLNKRGIYAWNGYFYASGLERKWGAMLKDGFCRIGLVHYHSLEDVERIIQALAEVS